MQTMYARRFGLENLFDTPVMCESIAGEHGRRVNAMAQVPRWLTLLVIPVLTASTSCSNQPVAQVPSTTPSVASPAPVAEAEPAPPPLSGNNLISKSNFDDGTWAPWWTHYVHPGNGYPSIQNDEFCFTLTSNALEPWHAQFHHGQMVAQKGHTYSIQFEIRATEKTQVYAIAGHPEPPYREYWGRRLTVDSTPQVVRGAFVMKDDDAAFELAFAMGGELSENTPLPVSVCVDEVHVDDPQFVPIVPEPPLPKANVLVNHIGYFPQLAKLAAVKANKAARWELLNSRNDVVASGTTVPAGLDPASGDEVSIADFSSFNQAGRGFKLRVDSGLSHEFDIGNDLYANLKYHAFAFLYHQRSGIEIKMPFSGEERWIRPAGHVNEGQNKGDRGVPCYPDSGCTYSLDVTGGWYDNDLHDKSMWVVNSSVWTLLNWWERATLIGSSAADFGDGKLNIPEQGNGVPDLLDEVRWALEFELKMQVPEGQPLAGMSHHGVRDKLFTDLGTAPHQDPQQRFLLPPTTAATLILAANAAQAARIWKSIDKDFSDACLAAAERAWAAARANPTVYAKVGLGGYDTGGGDSDVSDEFYWAAAELYITTGKSDYRQFLADSPYYRTFGTELPASAGDEKGVTTPMSSHQVAAFGSISLAVVPNNLGRDNIAHIRKIIVAAADLYLKVASSEGYRLPLRPGPKGYPWGSNWVLLNNLMTIALAFDFTRDVKYLNGVATGMDYILGRNTLDQGYVTGHGERPVLFPHHRFFAFQANPKYPKAPPGLLSGGPNSGLHDQYVQGLGLKGCAPAKCFADHVASYSTNGVNVGWNSSLAWVASFLDEVGPSGGRVRKPRSR